MLIVDETEQYSRIARGAYTRMLEIQGSIPEIDWSALNHLDDEAMMKFKVSTNLKEAAARESYIAVVFSALAVEAFINGVAIRSSSATFFKKHLDTLKVISKWVLVPKVLNLAWSLDQEGQAYEHLEALIKARNQLVHFKIQQLKSNKDMDSFKQKYTPSKDAAKAIATLDLIAEELGSPLGNPLKDGSK